MPDTLDPKQQAAESRKKGNPFHFDPKLHDKTFADQDVRKEAEGAIAATRRTLEEDHAKVRESLPTDAEQDRQYAEGRTDLTEIDDKTAFISPRGMTQEELDTKMEEVKGDIKDAGDRLLWTLFMYHGIPMLSSKIIKPGMKTTGRYIGEKLSSSKKIVEIIDRIEDSSVLDKTVKMLFKGKVREKTVEAALESLSEQELNRAHHVMVKSFPKAFRKAGAVTHKLSADEQKLFGDVLTSQAKATMGTENVAKLSKEAFTKTKELGRQYEIAQKAGDTVTANQLYKEIGDTMVKDGMTKLQSVGTKIDSFMDKWVKASEAGDKAGMKAAEAAIKSESSKLWPAMPKVLDRSQSLQVHRTISDMQNQIKRLSIKRAEFSMSPTSPEGKETMAAYAETIREKKKYIADRLALGESKEQLKSSYEYLESLQKGLVNLQKDPARHARDIAHQTKLIEAKEKNLQAQSKRLPAVIPTEGEIPGAKAVPTVPESIIGIRDELRAKEHPEIFTPPPQETPRAPEPSVITDQRGQTKHFGDVLKGLRKSMGLTDPYDERRIK